MLIRNSQNGVNAALSLFGLLVVFALCIFLMSKTAFAQDGLVADAPVVNAVNLPDLPKEDVDELTPTPPDYENENTVNSPEVSEADFAIFDDEEVGEVKIDEDGFVERPDDEFLILALNVNGASREAGIEAYLPQQKGPESVLIPLQLLADAMTFAIEVNPGDKMAEGWFKKESNIFQLDLNTREVTTANKSYIVPPDGAEAHIDDIYVAASQIKEWFNVDVQLDLASLTLYVKTGGSLAFQEAAARRVNAENQKRGTNTVDDFDIDTAYFPEYSFFTLPNVVMNKNFGISSSPEETSYSSSDSVEVNMDLLKFEADLNVGYSHTKEDGTKIDSSTLTFQRRDPKRNILGPLHAGKILIGDVNYPSVPLFGGASGRAAGVAISSDSTLGFKYARDGENFIIDGDAPANWDAELYRNGHFVTFQAIETDGRFSFEDLNLVDGYNRFEVVLYGPEGQKETIVREVFRGSNMQKPGELVYDITAGTPNADFLPLTEEARKERDPAISGQIFYGVNNRLTVGTSFFAGANADNENEHAGTLSASAAILGMNIQGQAMGASKGRSAYETSIRAKPFQINTALTHTINQGFSETENDTESTTQLSLSRNLGPIDTSFTLGLENKLDKEKITTIENITSTTIFNTKLTNEITRTKSNITEEETTNGTFNTALDLFDFRVRGDLNYNLSPSATDTFETLRLNAQHNFEDKSSLRLNGTYNFPTQIVAADARYSREFGPWALDFNVSGSSDDNYTAGISIRTGLKADADGKYKRVPASDATKAALGVRAYIDANGNDLYDEGEKILDQVGFRSNRAKDVATTNKEGISWIDKLTESPTKILVSHENIPSIYLVPSKNKLDVIPRRGARPVLDFAFKQMGEIDGFITEALTAEDMATMTELGAEIEPRTLSGITVKLLNAQTRETIAETTSESDGYYVFQSIPLGDYTIISTQGWFDGEEADIIEKTVRVTGDEPGVFDINLALNPGPEDDFANLDDEEFLKKYENQINGTVPTSIEPPRAPSNLITQGPADFVIQLISLSSRDAADAARVKYQNQYKDALNGLPLRVIAVEVKDTTYFRVVTDTQTRATGNAICKSLNSGCRAVPKNTFKLSSGKLSSGTINGALGFAAQFASMSTEQAARDTIDALKSEYATTFTDIDLKIVPVDVAGKTYFRVMSEASTQSDASDLCNAVKSNCRVTSDST